MIRTPVLIIVFLLVSSALLSQDNTSPDTIPRIFEKVEVEASFPGGAQAWRSFLEKNLNPNVPVDNGAPSGRYIVYVQFIVGKDGRVSDIKPLTRQGFGMEQEVVRTMRKSGLWTPAFQNSRPVNAYRKQPITFMVEEEGFNVKTKTPYTLFTDTDNEITVELDDVKTEDLEVSVSQGTIVNNGNGKFTVRISKPGRVLIAASSKKKKNKKESVMSLEVNTGRPGQ